MFTFPNLLTLANLFCGCTALLLLFRSDLPGVGLFLGLSMLFDLFDGLVARLLRQSSELGKQLDSLADMVSFGLVPGAIYYYLLAGTAHPHPRFEDQLYLFALPAFILTLFSALRLGKFNLDNRQSEHFIGLPTPACTLFALGLLLAAHDQTPLLAPLTNSPIFLYLCIAGFSLLLVAEIPMLSLKVKNLGWHDNWARYLLLGAALPILLILGPGGLPLVIIFYLLLSLTIEFSPARDH